MFFYNLHIITKAVAKENTNVTVSERANYVSKNAIVKASSVLPITGSKNTNVAGVIGLAIASVGSLLGLKSSKKN